MIFNRALLFSALVGLVLVLVAMPGIEAAAIVRRETSASVMVDLSADLTAPLASAKRLIAQGKRKTAAFRKTIEEVASDIKSASNRLEAQGNDTATGVSTHVQKQAARVIADVTSAYKKVLQTSPDTVFKTAYKRLDTQLARFLGQFNTTQAASIMQTAQQIQPAVLNVLQHLSSSSLTFDLADDLLDGSVTTSPGNTTGTTGTGGIGGIGGGSTGVNSTGCLNALGVSIACVNGINGTGTGPITTNPIALPVTSVGTSGGVSIHV